MMFQSLYFQLILILLQIVMSVLHITLDVTQMLLVLTYMEVINVNVIKDLKEMVQTAMVCNSDFFTMIVLILPQECRISV
jgi:hypothetical protein